MKNINLDAAEAETEENVRASENTSDSLLRSIHEVQLKLIEEPSIDANASADEQQQSKRSNSGRSSRSQSRSRSRNMSSESEAQPLSAAAGTDVDPPPIGSRKKVRFARLSKQSSSKSSIQRSAAAKAGGGLSVKDLFRFADTVDRLLIAFGLLCSLLAAAIYPILFMMFGKVATTFIDYQINKALQFTSLDEAVATTTATTNITELMTGEERMGNLTTTQNTCYRPSSPDVDFHGRILMCVYFYVTAGALSLLFYYLSHACLLISSEKQTKRAKCALFSSIIRQDINFFETHQSGELNNIYNNIEVFKLGIGPKFADFASMLGRGVGCLTFAMIASWRFSLVFLTVLPLAVLSIILMVTVIKKYSIEEVTAYEQAGNIAQETLGSVRTVFAYGLQRTCMRNYAASLRRAERMSVRKGLLAGVFESLSVVLFNLCFGVGVYYSVYLVRTDCGANRPEQLINAFFSVITATFSLGQALSFFKDLAEAKLAAAKVYAIVDAEPTLSRFQGGGVRVDELRGAIEFEAVSFAYAQRKDVSVLRQLSFRIEPGRTVAIVGASGSGKSTALALLQRFHAPTEGAIRIDERDISALNLDWLRGQMALISQEPTLFATTIGENIRYGRLDASDEAIEEAARQANAHEFIMSFPEKYNTLVGERGVQLSGGQKQRIAIARALIRNPRILLLDEATSALDNESERVVQDALDRAKVGRTTLIVAHRLSTIRNADLIIGMADGQVKEMGTHDQLMAAQGLYHQLVTLQQQKQFSEDSDDIGDNKNDAALITSNKVTHTPLALALGNELNEKQTLRKNTNQLASASSVSIASRDDESNNDTADKDENSAVSPSERKKSSWLALFGDHEMLRYEKKLFGLQVREVGWLLVGLVSQMIAATIVPAITFLFSQIYKLFALRDEREQAAQSVTCMLQILALGAINFVVIIAYNLAFAVCGARLTTRVRARMFEALLRQETAFYDRAENLSGVLCARLATSAPYCRGLTTDKLSVLFQALAGIGFALLLAFMVSWKLTLLLLVFVPLSVMSGIVRGRTSTSSAAVGADDRSESAQTQRYYENVLIGETISNIYTVVSLGLESFFADEFDRRQLARLNRSCWRAEAFWYCLSESVIFFYQAVAYYWGYLLVTRDGLDIASVYGVIIAVNFSSILLGRNISQLPDQRKSMDAARTVFRIIDRQSKIDALSEQGQRPDKFIGEIRFVDVHFSYPTRPNVKILRGLNMSISNGQTNALVGTSGCGKSTTCSLLLRFYDVDSGSITLDGIDIRQLNINWLRSKIGIVSQEPVLFNMSIMQNIRLGDVTRSDIPLEEIFESAKHANVHNKIENLPEKYETVVGSKGSQLSGGEKQRIAIARALVRNPRILLLDEATSALDTQSEQLVQDALDKAQLNRTCVIIAHRLSTIQNAHKICVLREGVLVEEGTHQQLMSPVNADSIYQRLQKH